MRGTVTGLIVAAVGAVVLAGVVDAIRGSVSHPQTGAGPSVTKPSTATTPPEQTTTEAAAITNASLTTPVKGNVTATEPVSTRRLPSCDTDQLRLAFTGSGGLAAVVLRRVKGPPCHHDQAEMRFIVRTLSGASVAVFAGTDTIAPADFEHGFEQLANVPQMSCDPGESFRVVAMVGPYVAQRTVSGTHLPCNHG